MVLIMGIIRLKKREGNLKIHKEKCEVDICGYYKAKEEENKYTQKLSSVINLVWP